MLGLVVLFVSAWCVISLAVAGYDSLEILKHQAFNESLIPKWDLMSRGDVIWYISLIPVLLGVSLVISILEFVLTNKTFLNFQEKVSAWWDKPFKKRK